MFRFLQLVGYGVGIFISLFGIWGLSEGDLSIGLPVLAAGVGIFCFAFFGKRRARRGEEIVEDNELSEYTAAAPAAPVFKTKRMLRDERRAEAKAQGLASCPRCGSTSLSVNKKGFSAGQAYAGMFTAGGILLGAVGMNKLRVTCLNCGYRFKPGKGRQ